jgi:hypothetical protein
LACIDKSTVDLNKGRSGFLNFLDVPASKKSNFVFIAVNEYTSSLERNICECSANFSCLLLVSAAGPCFLLAGRICSFYAIIYLIIDTVPLKSSHPVHDALLAKEYSAFKR